jgi:hypothetical protein
MLTSKVERRKDKITTESTEKRIMKRKWNYIVFQFVIIGVNWWFQNKERYYA